MARRLRGLFVAAVLLAALLPAAQGQDWAEMAYYQVIMQAGNKVYAYAYTGLAYPEPYLPCPLPYYIFEDCWDQYSTHAEADLYRDGWWVTGSQDWQFNGEAYAWVWAPAEGGWWSLASWHELDVQWEDWFDWWSWVTRYDYLYDYLLGYLQVSDPPPVVSSLVPSAALRGESGQVTIYGEHFGQSPWVEVGGTGVTMQVTSVGQGWIQAQYWVESNAESGDHAVTVRTASGTSNPAAFTVQDPTPVVSWIDPDIWEASWSNVPVTIYGSGFGDNPVVNAGSWAAVSVQWANGVEIHGTVSVDPNAPDTMETVTVTSRGWGGQGFMPAPGASQTANATVQIRGAGLPAVTLRLERPNVTQIWAYGSPAPGTYDWNQDWAQGQNAPWLEYAPGVDSRTQPNPKQVVVPGGDSGRNPGGLSQYRVRYWDDYGRSTPERTIRLASFGVTCYIVADEADWYDSQTGGCRSTVINGRVYEGWWENPPGLPGMSLCAAFLGETKLNGSGLTRSGTKIRWVANDVYERVQNWTTRDGDLLGQELANRLVARSPEVIPLHQPGQPRVYVELSGIGSDLLAGDGGGWINGYRLDLFKGIGHASGCPNAWSNRFAVGACNPETAGCPKRELE